ncbi:MAG: hypothetical protein JXR97_10945 [Planctomycetes bacterium]|nr:hypothetical protein [Planctomycetota bacterium]
MRSRKFASLFLLFTLVAFSASQAAAAGYVKKWIWTASEKKKLAELEKKVENKDSFWTIESDHWICKSQIDAKFTAECSLFMEIFYDVFVNAFGMKKKPALDAKQTLIVFASEAAYQAKCPITGSRGYYSPGELELVTYMEAGRLLTFSNCYHPVIQHEGTHALFHRFMGKKPIPFWLNEGMATFYEYWDYRSTVDPMSSGSSGKKARMKRLTLSYRKHFLRDWIRDSGGVYPKLSYVMGLNSYAQWDVDNMGRKTGFHYGAAECVADWMHSDKNARKALMTIFENLEKAEVGRDAQGYGIITSELLPAAEINDLEKSWHKFLSKTWGISGKAPKD